LRGGENCEAVSGALTLVKPVAGLWRKIDMLTALNLRSGRAMQVAPKQAELRDIARHLLTLAETLREQRTLRADLLDGARELASQGELATALSVLRVVKLDRLRAAAAKTLKAELRSVVRARSLSPPSTRR
jgi:hypothetical protein